MNREGKKDLGKDNLLCVTFRGSVPKLSFHCGDMGR